MNPIAKWMFEIVYSLLPLVFTVIIQSASGKSVTLGGTEFFITSLILAVNTTTDLMAALSEFPLKISLNDFWMAITIHSFQAGTLVLTILMAISIMNPVPVPASILLTILVICASGYARHRFIWRYYGK